MIKLTTKIESCTAAFYFNSIEDTAAFIDVFTDHWCNVPWDVPVEVTEDNLSPFDTAFINISPKIRAMANLSWGFALCQSLDIGLTKRQEKFVDAIVNKQQPIDEWENYPEYMKFVGMQTAVRKKRYCTPVNLKEGNLHNIVPDADGNSKNDRYRASKMKINEEKAGG